MKSTHRKPVSAQQDASWLIRSAVTAALAAGTALPAFAQQSAAPADETVIEEVVVTGSRIARRDLASDSPLVTVSSQALQNTSQIGLDQVLSRLPQFVPRRKPEREQR